MARVILPPGAAFFIHRQPNDTTCGPTSLHAVYRYYGDSISLEEVIATVPSLASGGTYGVLLANHALQRGYEALIYTYNLHLFDPTWFTLKSLDLSERLREQFEHKHDPRLKAATDAYLEFLRLGGRLQFDDLTPALLRRHLKRGELLLAGLSATYLYRAIREYGPEMDDDDVRGEAVGHYVVLTEYHARTRTVAVADPMKPNPMAPGQHYDVPIDRVVGAIFLGVLTYDGNLLVIWPKR